MNNHNLTLYDFIVDIVPGACAILLGLSLLPEEAISGADLADLTVGSSVLIVVLGYFMGHLVQALTSPIDDWTYFLNRDEYPFEKALSGAKSGSVEDKFTDLSDSVFREDDVDCNDLSGYERFKLTQSYLWSNDIGRSRRFQILYTFLRSMWVLLFLGAVLHLIVLAGSLWLGYPILWTVMQSGTIIVVLAVSSLLMYQRRLKYQNMMVDAMIYDFYVHILTQQD